MFDIPQSESQLPRRNFADTEIRQVSAQNAVKGDAFSNGTHTFRVAASGPDKWIIPSKCFIGLKVKLTKGDRTTQLKLEDGIALAQNTAANLFSNVEVRMSGEVISSTHANLPHVDTLMQRLHRSGAWLSSLGDNLNNWAPYADRLHRVCSDGGAGQGPLLVTKATDMGYAATDTWALDTTTGILTLNRPGGGMPQGYWQVGDEFAYRDEGAGTCVCMKIGSIGGQAAGADHTFGMDLSDITGGDIAATVFGTRVYKEWYERDPNATEFQLMWQPPSPFFHATTPGSEGIPQAGEIEINLHPAVEYKRLAIESRGVASATPSVTGGAAGDYHFEVTEMYLYVMETRGPMFAGDQYVLDLHEIQAQTASIDSSNTQEVPFTVNRNTEALTVAFVDRRQQVDSRVASTRFHAYQSSLADGRLLPQEDFLTQFQISYAGKQHPPNLNQLGFGSGQNYLTQRYLESLIYAGKGDMDADVESFKEWRERGMYLYWRCDKDAHDDSTRVIVKTQFGAGFEHENMQVMLFEHRRLIVKVNIGAGRRVSSVQVST